MVKRIKVCHIITMLELGGAQENTLYTCRHLNKDKFDVILIAGQGGILDKQTIGIKTFFVKTLVRQISPIKDIIAIKKIYKILKKEKPDIVHTHSSKAGILGRWAAHFAKVPTIIHTFHGFGFNDFQPYPVKMAYVLAEQRTAKITDKFIAVSYDNIEKGLKNKIGTRDQYTVIRSGIKLQEYQTAVDVARKKKELGITNEPVVGMIACFKNQKAPLDFIKTAELVCEKNPNTKFVLVGDGVLRAQIENEIEKLNLKNNVILTGWRNDIPELIKIFDVSVLTSLWEGLPKVVVQSMAAGVPVVATYIDGTKEVIEEGLTGFFVAPHEIGMMSERILRLLNDPDLRKQFAQEAKKKVQEFDIDLMVSQQETLYTRILASQNGKFSK